PHPPPRAPPPSPTRRSSDPSRNRRAQAFPVVGGHTYAKGPPRITSSHTFPSASSPQCGHTVPVFRPCASISQRGQWTLTTSGSRSEEHTSELQSLTKLACRL